MILLPQYFQDLPHQILQGISHLYSMWKIQKFHCMLKDHLISTFFSESALNTATPPHCLYSIQFINAILYIAWARFI